MIEKYVETYKIAHLPFKLHKNILTVSSLTSKINEEQQKASQTKNGKGLMSLMNSLQSDKRNQSLNIKNDDEDFIKGVADQLQKNMCFVINIKKCKPIVGESSQKCYSVVSVE